MRYVPSLLTDEELTKLENIGFANNDVISTKGRARVTARRRNIPDDDAKVSFSITNNLESDIYMAWQTPDHSRIRTQRGMHVDASLIKAGSTQTIQSFHRHGFYFWDAKEGVAAPLYREGDDKRWVRRMRASALVDNQDVVIDESFHVEVVNLSPTDNEIFLIGTESHTLLGVARGAGGALQLQALDGQVLEIQDINGAAKRVTVHRSDGHPQLLPVGISYLQVATYEHDEL